MTTASVFSLVVRITQFSHRIKKKLWYSVTIEVEETGEAYRYTP